jgi:hypothetical protein
MVQKKLSKPHIWVTLPKLADELKCWLNPVWVTSNHMHGLIEVGRTIRFALIVDVGELGGMLMCGEINACDGSYYGCCMQGNPKAKMRPVANKQASTISPADAQSPRETKKVP